MIAAAAEGHRHVVWLLIRNGAEVNAKDRQNQTALMRAVSRQDLKLAKLLIRLGGDVNARGTNGDTALHMAIRRGGEEMFRLLLRAGADIHLKRYDSGRRGPLEIAKVWKRHRFIEILDEWTSHGAQPVGASEERPLAAKTSVGPRR
jgi:ankyrin repeat protein